MYYGSNLALLTVIRYGISGYAGESGYEPTCEHAFSCKVHRNAASRLWSELH